MCIFLLSPFSRGNEILRRGEYFRRGDEDDNYIQLIIYIHETFWFYKFV